jgi:GNAT superfamily N-acetyltransferase
MSQCVIETASKGALPASLALLAPINHPETVVVTARDADGVLAGAGGILWQSWGRPPGFPVWVQVLPDFQRRGVGGALVQALIERSFGEADRLWVAKSLVEDSPAHLFASSTGFDRGGKQLVFETDSLRFLTEISSIVERLRSRHRIPSDAGTQPLTAELIPAVSRLLLSQLETIAPDIERQMELSLEGHAVASPVDRDRSRVLLLAGQVAGALLSRRLPDGRSSAIICNVIAPNFRRGWANAVLLESTTRAGVEDGCPQFQFDCADTNRDTIGLARRCDAELVRTESLFRYALASAS